MVIQEVGQIAPVVTCRLYSKDDTSALSLKHFCPGSLQRFLKAIPRIGELKFRLDYSILCHDHHRVLLLVRIHSYDQIPLWDLL